MELWLLEVEFPRHLAGGEIAREDRSTRESRAHGLRPFASRRPSFGRSPTPRSQRGRQRRPRGPSCTDARDRLVQQCEGCDLNAWTSGRRRRVLAALACGAATSRPSFASLTRTLRERILSPRENCGCRWKIVPGISPGGNCEGRSLRGPSCTDARDRLVQQCEGCDLNAWTPTGADLESAAVSRLGYPRTQSSVIVSGISTSRFLLQNEKTQSPRDRNSQFSRSSRLACSSSCSGSVSPFVRGAADCSPPSERGSVRPSASKTMS